MNGRSYDVAPDGRRFLMLRNVGSGGGAESSEIVVVLNWQEELARLLPDR